MKRYLLVAGMLVLGTLALVAVPAVAQTCHNPIAVVLGGWEYDSGATVSNLAGCSGTDDLGIRTPLGDPYPVATFDFGLTAEPVSLTVDWKTGEKGKCNTSGGWRSQASFCRLNYSIYEAGVPVAHGFFSDQVGGDKLVHSSVTLPSGLVTNPEDMTISFRCAIQLSKNPEETTCFIDAVSVDLP